MTAAREPIPPGTVSSIQGRRQIPALTWATRIVLVVSVVGGLGGHALGDPLAVAAVAVIVAAPPLRVCWLIRRWAQESDGRFVATGSALLAVISIGAILAALGVGS